MKQYIIQSIRLTVVLIVLLCVIYPLIVAFAGSFSAGESKHDVVVEK